MSTSRTLSLLLLIVTLSLYSCGDNAENKDTQSKEEMGQFGDDEQFKAAHEKPREVEVAGNGEMYQFDTPDGQKGQAYTLKSKDPSDKYLFVVHEWYGLNDNIRSEAERYFAEIPGINVMALDIYDGQHTDNPDEAGKLMQAVKKERAEAIIKGAIADAGANARIATIGWCFGGGWSLRSSILAADQGVACVMYYGMPVQKADELLPLKADILGIYAERDAWITPEVANNFEALAKATGKKVTHYHFEADHAFANPSGERYNEEAAQKANAIAMDFIKKRL